MKKKRSKYSSETKCNPSTLVDLLRWRALHQPDQMAYTFLLGQETEQTYLTYAQVDRQARSIAASLQQLGIGDEPVLLLYPPGLDFITSFFGCLYSGAIPLTACSPDVRRVQGSLWRIQSIAQDAQPRIVLTTESTISSILSLLAQLPELKDLSWLATETMKNHAEDKWREPHLSSDSLALLQYTSGSLSYPKGVMLTHANLLHNMRMIDAAIKHTPEDKYVSWLPTFHDMGMMAGVLEPLFAGVPAILMAPSSFLQKPSRWLEAISRYKATISGGPNFAYDLCVRRISVEDRDKLDLSKWSLAFNGSEPVRADSLNLFSSTFEACGFRGEAFYPCYGLAEATLMVSGRPRISPLLIKRFDEVQLQTNKALEALDVDKNSKALVSVGRTLLNERIIIVDPDSLAESMPNAVGEIWVSGSNIAKGYWNRPMETDQVFHAYLSSTGEGPFLRTGDLGFLYKKELYITGRLKEVIIFQGMNQYPADIEHTVEQCHPAFRPGCGAAFTIESAREERLVIIQEVEIRQKLDVNLLIHAVREAVAVTHGLEVYAIALIKPRTIPKTSSGKIQRFACRANFLSKSLDVVAEWCSTLTTATETSSNGEVALDIKSCSIN